MAKQADRPDRPQAISPSKRVQLVNNTATLREALVRNAAECNTLRTAIAANPPADLAQAYRATLAAVEAAGILTAAKLGHIVTESKLPVSIS